MAATDGASPDLMTMIIFWSLQLYLTSVWNMNFIHAAAIVNLFDGVVAVMSVCIVLIVELFALSGNGILFLCNISFSIGLILFSISAPKVRLDSKDACQTIECIGRREKTIFYVSLALMALGKAGRDTCLANIQPLRKKIASKSCCLWLIFSSGTIACCIALLFVKTWRSLFIIPTVYMTLDVVCNTCMLCSLLLVISRQGYSITESWDLLKENQSDALKSILEELDLRLEEEEEEEEELDSESQSKTKAKICSIPLLLTITISWLVSSIGKTFFAEQADNMRNNVGRLKIPAQVFCAMVYDTYNILAFQIYNNCKKFPSRRGLRQIIISISMAFSVFSCIVAAVIETRRLNVVRRSGLLEKPGETVPMSMFWLIPQFFFLAMFDGLLQRGVTDFIKKITSRKTYAEFFTTGLSGIGTFCGVLSVHLAKNLSKRGGRQSWFQENINTSHLNDYYWMVAALGAVNFVLYNIIAACYRWASK